MLRAHGKEKDSAKAPRERVGEMGNALADVIDEVEIRQVVEISDLASENDGDDEGGRM